MSRASAVSSIAILSLLACACSAHAAARAPAPAADPAAVAGPIAEGSYPGTLTLTVDATDISRRVFRVRQQLPVRAGRLTLLFPKWIPGKHRPDGPIHRLAGLRISAGGQPLTWARDARDVHAFAVDVPAGVTTLDIAFDMLTPTAGNQGRVVMTPDMLNLEWGTVALYPAGYPVRDIRIAPTLVLPAGWQAGTALELQARRGDTLAFAEVSFETLQDSPVYAGRHFRQVDLDPGAAVPVTLAIIADAPRYLDYTEAQIGKHRAMVQQAYRLFDSRHFDHYEFLFSLSDRMGGNGLEHHRSSENGVAPGYFTEWDKNVARRELLAHEFVHSWNGKFRRPEGLATPDFHVPMEDSLLWVYEGQTQYWGKVLAARSGLWDRQTALDSLAVVAATYDGDRPGLAWRNVQDTTHDPIIAMRRPQPYRSHQLSEDYYNAGALIWLAVDARLRALTGERRSLDDFASRFFGIDDGSWSVLPYSFDDVVAALDGIAPHDWAGFLRSRLDAHAAPLDGLAASGWKLVYRDTQSAYQKAAQAARKTTDYTGSLGLVVANGSGIVEGVRWDGPAFNAGIAPDSTLLAVNGYVFETAALDDAIKAAQTGGTPIELVVKHGDSVQTVAIDYRGGLRYPHLERIAGTPDRLSKILTPL